MSSADYIRAEAVVARRWMSIFHQGELDWIEKQAEHYARKHAVAVEAEEKTPCQAKTA